MSRSTALSARAVPLLAMPAGESKGTVARRLLGEFAARRHDDLFAMVAFSNHPIVILPFTQKQTLVQAAIEAGDIGKGLAETDVGGGSGPGGGALRGPPL